MDYSKMKKAQLIEEIEALQQKTKDLECGDHLCCLYETEQEHRAVLTPFLRQGLERGEKVLYIVDTRTAEDILGYLQEDGLDVEPYLARGQLAILTRDDAYLREGVFDPEGMIALLRAETERALAEGYSVLRVTGEMTWALRGLPGSERLIEYEAKLNEFFPGSKCLAICQYDRRRFDPEVLLDVLRTHPIAVIGTEVYDNFYYVPPAEVLGEESKAAELRRWLENLVERKRAEEALRESEKRFREVLEHSRDVLYKRNLETGRYEYISPAIAEITGYTPDAVRAMSPDEIDALIHPEDIEWINDLRRNMLEAPQGREIVSRAEYRVKCKDGSYRWISDHYALLRGPEGRPLFSVASVRDITERKRAEEEIKRRSRELAALNAIAAGVSQSLHLNEILNAALQETLAVLNAEGGLIYLFDETSQTFAPAVHRGLSQDVLREVTGFKMGEGLSGRAAESGQALVVADLAADPRNISPAAVREGWHAYAGVPIISKETVLGVMTLVTRQEGYFGPDHVGLLGHIGNQIGVAIENARLYEELEQKVEELGLLLDTATAASSTLDLDRVLPILVEKMTTSVEATFCRIALLDEMNQALTIRAASGIRGPDWDPGLGRQFALADAPWHGQAIERGEAVVLRQDDPSKAVSEAECRIALGEGINSALLIPLMIGDRILGVASLGEMRGWERTPFTAHRVRLCQALADQAAIAIENSRLYREADEARRRYQDLYDNAPVMYHTIDTKGIVLECNQTEADMLGYSKEEIVGQPIYAFETQEYQDLAPHALREGMEKGHAVGERRFVKKDGTVIDALLDAQAIYDDSGQVVGFRSTLTDLTERVRMEEALRESEEQFRQLAENIREIFWMTDLKNAQLIYISPAYEEIWGRTCESLYEQPRSRLNAVHPEDRERVIATYAPEKLIRGGSDVQYRIERPDGSVRWIRDRGFPIRNELGEVYRIAGIAEDITARKGEELAVAEERSRIAREIHDAIIQELSSLGLGLDFCIKEIERDSATVRQELTRIRELLRHNIRELRHTILALRPVELEKQGLVPTLENYVREWGRRTRIQTHVSVVGGWVELPVEVQTALFRLVQESLNNVRKHAAAHQVWVTLNTTPTTVSLTVRDDGRGFDLSTTAATSIGLGLRQMHERAEAVSGRLEILATPGEGTEVHFILPRGSPRVNE